MLRHLGVRAAGILLGAVALFAIVGYAASFAINLGPMVNAEGETLVVSCSEIIKVDKSDEWRNPAAGSLPGDGGFYVKRVRVIINAEREPDCVGKYFYVVLTGRNGEKLAASPGGITPTLQDGANSVDFSAANVRVADLHDIHVLISGTPQNP